MSATTTGPEVHTFENLTFKKVSPALGLEVHGFDISNCSDAGFKAIVDQWVEANGVIVLKNVQMTPAQHVDLASRFGEPFGKDRSKSVLTQYYHPEHPEIYRVSNKSIDGLPLGREDAGTYWHSDGSTSQSPHSCSILHAIEIPPYGGDTQFTSMVKAYDALSETMQQLLHGLSAVHSLANTVSNGNKTSYGKELVGKMDLAAAKTATHPVVRVHPVSGKKCLFINPGFTSHIVGMTQEESMALLQFLFAHCIQPEFIYRHRYTVNDVVVWDNRCTMHYAVSDYKSVGGRYMHRVTCKGEVPIAA